MRMSGVLVAYVLPYAVRGVMTTWKPPNNCPPFQVPQSTLVLQLMIGNMTHPLHQALGTHPAPGITWIVLVFQLWRVGTTAHHPFSLDIPPRSSPRIEYTVRR